MYVTHISPNRLLGVALLTGLSICTPSVSHAQTVSETVDFIFSSRERDSSANESFEVYLDDPSLPAKLRRDSLNVFYSSKYKATLLGECRIKLDRTADSLSILHKQPIEFRERSGIVSTMTIELTRRSPPLEKDSSEIIFGKAYFKGSSGFITGIYYETIAVGGGDGTKYIASLDTKSFHSTTLSISLVSDWRAAPQREREEKAWMHLLKLCPSKYWAF